MSAWTLPRARARYSSSPTWARFPERVAYDLMAQAEHLSGASAVLLTPSAELVRSVEPLLSGEPAELITLVRVRDAAQAVEIANLYAPEHAHVISEDLEAILQDLDAAGMVAIGDFSPVAPGRLRRRPLPRPPDRRHRDVGFSSRHPRLYRAHELHPLHPEALASLGPHVERLARLEGFENHAASVGVRLRKEDVSWHSKSGRWSLTRRFLDLCRDAQLASALKRTST
jgi:histidinol dehydrogenase